ncbi:hypothetical protein KM043_007841 [Ampulex compressa]|nr:hypothetical protein KM043_007841 [Ampulex compressa]
MLLLLAEPSQRDEAGSGPPCFSQNDAARCHEWRTRASGKYRPSEARNRYVDLFFSANLELDGQRKAAVQGGGTECNGCPSCTGFLEGQKESAKAPLFRQ